MQDTTTITSKGQVAIPIEFRRILGLVPGSKIKFEIRKEKNELIAKPVLDLVKLKGYFKTKKKFSKAKAREAYLKDVIANKI